MNAPLFEIQVLHSYFRNGRFQSCRVVADEKTQTIFDRYGFMTRTLEGVFGCYQLGSGDANALLRYLNDQQQVESFCFLLMADAAQFAFISDVPLDWVGQVAMDSGSGTATPSGDQPCIRLTTSLGERTIDQAGVIGSIVIHLNDLLAENGAGIRYVASFEARAFPWRYYVVNRSQTKLNAPAVRDKNQLYLEGPSPKVFPNGEAGLCFSSGDQAFRLQQVPTRIFDLIDRLPSAIEAGESSQEHCVLSGLPTPSLDQWRQARGNKAVFGAMYVYL